MKTFWTILVSVILSLAITAVVGYFVFYKDFYVSDKNNLNSKIEKLEKSVNDDAATSSSSNNVSSTAATIMTDVDLTNWKTYTDSTYKFSFKYPDTWTGTEEVESYNDARKELITMSGSVTGKTYYAEVFSSSKDVTSFVKSFYKDNDGPISISSVKAGDQEGIKFIVKDSTVSSDSSKINGSVYFAFKKDSTIVIFYSTTGEETEADLLNDINLNAIASTFAFNS